MQTFKTIFALALVGVFAYLAITVYIQYRAATGPLWQRALAAAQNSATILWAKFGMLLAALVGAIGDIGDLFGDPNIRGYAETFLGNPKVVAGILLAFSLVTVAARKRTL